MCGGAAGPLPASLGPALSAVHGAAPPRLLPRTRRQCPHSSDEIAEGWRVEWTLRWRDWGDVERNAGDRGW